MIGALAHLYRGEMYQSKIWRNRLDTTSNWAVVITGIALSVSFSHAEASPIPILLVSWVAAVFLYFVRAVICTMICLGVRVMEINFYGPMLRGQGITIDNNWNDLLAGIVSFECGLDVRHCDGAHLHLPVAVHVILEAMRAQLFVERFIESDVCEVRVCLRPSSSGTSARLSRVLCGDKSGYGSEASQTPAIPIFILGGLRSRTSCSLGDLRPLRSASPSLFGLAFRLAKGTLPRMSAKNKEAPGRLYFSSRPTPRRQPSASWPLS